MSRSILISLVAALAGLVAAAATTAAGPNQHGTVVQWTIDGSQREALVFAPRSVHGAAEHPLVVAFHGHGGDMKSTAARMHIETLWPQAIVVYPQGLDTPTPHDPAGTKSGWQGRAGELRNRDLKFFDAMVATIKRTYAVDGRRIYATGFSNGAVFSMLLWAQRAKMIAAVAEVAGRLDPAETLTSPRAFLAVAGRSDPVAPFALQWQTIQQARQVDDATGPGFGCGVFCTQYPSADGPVPVKTFVHPGGHVYPAWAPAETVSFFKAHRRP